MRAPSDTDVIPSVLGTRRPEDVFGDIPQGERDQALATLADRWRALSREVHPDTNHDPRAEAAFKRLGELYEAAKKAIVTGAYGKRPVIVDSVLIQTARHAYRVHDLINQGDSCNIYAATYASDEGEHQGLLKVARDRRDNSLVANEARTLKALLSNSDTFDEFSPYLPPYKESFGYRSGKERKARQGIAYGPTPPETWYTLRDVHQRYPKGVNVKDMSWMFRRLLSVIGTTSTLGYVHGAILPEHVLIEPGDRGLMLIDWKYSVEVGQRVTAIPSGSRDRYPYEVLEKRPATAATDIYMAARCMQYILGADFGGLVPERSAPRQIRGFLRGTALPRQSRRPQDAFGLLDEFDELIFRLWGPRRRHKALVM